MGNSARQISPNLSVSEVSDTYVRENFRQLMDSFGKNNQLEGFKFVTGSFDGSGTIKLAHGLGYTPLDLLLLSSTGPGVITVNYANFDAQYIEVSSTGQASFRAFVGTYWGNQ